MARKKQRLSPMNVNVNLPVDLMIDILARLPVKSLLRFKSVCKEWCALISSSSFASLQLDRSISNSKRQSTLVHVFDGHKNKFRAFDPTTVSDVTNSYPGLNEASSFGEGLWFVGSHNGVLCLCDRLIEWLWLWNPSIRQFKTLPSRGTKRTKLCSVGFGCDPSNIDGYKVVVIGHLSTTKSVTRTHVEVWSANLGSWKEINVEFNFTPLNTSATTIRGFAYWTVQDGVAGYDDQGDKILVASFDMTTEVLQLFPVPEVVADPDHGYRGLIWNENFALAICQGGIIQVWTMDNDHVEKISWSKIFTLELELDTVFIHDMLTVGNGKLFLCDWISDMVILYDIKTKRTENIHHAENNMLRASIANYMESLLSGDGFRRLGKNAKLADRSRRSCTGLN